MPTLRLRPAAVLMLLAAIGCATPARVPHPAAMDGGGDDDAVRLTNGDVVRGRIVEETPRQVVLERDTVVSTYPRGAVAGVDYSKERWQERRQALAPSDPPPASVRPSTTWLPRTDPREPVQQTEVLFYDTHALTECVGPALAQAHQELPDLRLFVEPGGRIVLHDPKQWGYHAHLPGGTLRIPAGKPGLSIELPKDEAALPETISFVSPAQEIKAGEGETRTSYALPDAVHAVLKSVSIAETMLAIQPFAGGKPAATPNGTLWAFTLPRNSRQFFVYLLDRTRRHGEILKASFVGFGDTVLAADLIVDLIGADGVALGRVLAIPYPDQVSADGPAREPLVVYAGPLKDPTEVVTLALPPREAIQLPSKPSSMRADVLVSHYEVFASVPQSVVLATGVGRPLRDVTLVSRELTPGTPDQVLKIDLSSLPEERFPAVAWLYQRRTYVWKTTGGYRPPVTPAPVPPRRDARLAKVKRSDAIPHLIPMTFTGPKPTAAFGAGRTGVDPAGQVAGGMASGLIHEAIARESGGSRSLTQNITPAAAEGMGSVSNVTTVYISSPPHTPLDFGGQVDRYRSMDSGRNYYDPMTAPFVDRTPKPAPPYRPPMTYDPQTGSTGEEVEVVSGNSVTVRRRR